MKQYCRTKTKSISRISNVSLLHILQEKFFLVWLTKQNPAQDYVKKYT